MQIGLDIGSTMTKCVVMEGDELLEAILTPTGFSSVDTAERVAAARRFAFRGATERSRR